ncbi:MAG: glutathione-disulfide reductase [Gammaproteobacteria bacterium]|nr:glutathione-disulfide reductase [Gammaproteobacteria bacterium]
MSEKKHYDVIAIGGGSGGLAMVQRAAEYGKRCAVVEAGRLGGTCVNVGCVPKKVMWYAAQHAHGLRHAASYGFDLQVSGHDWGRLRRGRDAYLRRLNGIYAGNLERKNVVLYPGYGEISGPGQVNVDGVALTADRVVIATGGHPVVPAIPGAQLGITSDDFFNKLDALPARVGIVGSGYIATELACLLAALGSDVTVFVRFESVLRSFEPMLQEKLLRQMQQDGIKVVTNTVPVALENDKQGLSLLAENGARHAGLEVLIWAVGRAPNTATLGLQQLGIDMDKRGFVRTDDLQRTSLAGTYAIGDVTGREALTPVAIAAGRRLSDRLYGGMPGRHLDYQNIPTVIFTHPPIGTVGLTEPEARAKFPDQDVRVYTSEFVPMYYAMMETRVRTSMKLVTVGAEERVLGCHIIGDGADEMLQGFAVAIRMGACKQDFDDTIAIHPTSAEELVTMR